MRDYIRHEIINVVDIKGLTALEFLNFQGKYKAYSEKHNFWELCYVKSGEIDLIVNGSSVKLSEKQLFLIPPDCEHSYVSKNNKDCVFVACFESISHILKPVAMTCFRLNDVQMNCMENIIFETKNTFVMNSRDLLEVNANPNFGGKQAIILQLEYLLICLTRQLSAEKNLEWVFLREESFYSDLADVIISFLNENVHRKLSLDDICEKMHYSRSFLCKVFKMETKETIFSYFNRLKMDEAKKMLAETSLSISDISYRLGFDEVKYFDYFFKKYEGVTPSKFRRAE